MDVVVARSLGKQVEGEMVELMVPKNSNSSSKSIVSVLMTVYNERPDYLNKAINSILNQTFSNFEMIIEDDGSDDERTVSVLKYWETRDKRVRIFHEPHQGLTSALNRGLLRCRGEFVCRQDSDDWSERIRIEKQVQFLRSDHTVAIVGSYSRCWREDDSVLWTWALPTTPEDVQKMFIHTSPFSHGAVCFRREAMLAVGGYREEMVCCQDYDCFWRLCDRFSGANIPEVLYNYRFTGASITARLWYEQTKAKAAARLLAEARRKMQVEDVEEALRNADILLAGTDVQYWTMLRTADHNLFAGIYRKAFGSYFHAIERRPLSPAGWLKLIRAGLFLILPGLRIRLFGYQLWTITPKWFKWMTPSGS